MQIYMKFNEFQWLSIEVQSNVHVFLTNVSEVKCLFEILTSFKFLKRSLIALLRNLMTCLTFFIEVYRNNIDYLWNLNGLEAVQSNSKVRPHPKRTGRTVRSPKNQKNLQKPMENWYFYKPVVARTGSAESKTRVMESFGKYKEPEAERKLLYVRPRHGFAASLRGFAPRYSKKL